MALRFSAAALSETGPARGENQDTVFAGSALLCVADGVGGAPAGDLASAVAALCLIDAYRAQPHNLSSIYRQAVLDMQVAFGAIVTERPELRDMASTLTALLIDGDKAMVLHIGDSRAYRLRGETLEQLSRDHTFVERLVQHGELDPAEAFGHPARNVVLKVVGARPDLMDFRIIDLAAGDRVLLCSDGLSDYVPSEEICRSLRGHGGPQRVAEDLIDRALAAPTRDNVSVVVADVEETSDSWPKPSAADVLLGSAAEQALARHGISEITRWAP